MEKQKELVKAIINEDYNETYNILCEINENDDGVKYVEYLINFMMENPDIDYGMPGPIVHFIEKYPIDYYVGYLIEAIEKKPNDTLLWMLNRITNITVGSDRDRYIEILKHTSERNDIDDITREGALQFYRFQISTSMGE